MRLGGFHENALEDPLQRMHPTDVGQAAPTAISGRLVACSKLALNRNPVAPALGQVTEQRRSVYAEGAVDLTTLACR